MGLTFLPCQDLLGRAAMVGINPSGYKITKGNECVKTIELDVIEKEPGYYHSFCERCGSPVTLPDPEADFLEVSAGTFDSELPISPDKHIFVELTPNWDKVNYDLPTYTKDQIQVSRKKPK